MGILEGVKFFKDFSKKDLVEVEIFCQERLIPKGEYVFKEGDEANAMYILASGVVEVSKEIDSKKVVLGEVAAEEVLGEMAMYEESGKRTASAIAVNNTRLIVILSFSIKQLEKKHPEFIEKIKNIIKQRKKENKNILGFKKVNVFVS